MNNAGINIARPVEQFSDEDWRRILGINLDVSGSFRGTLFPTSSIRGVILNIASVGAFQASHDRAPYMASK